MIAFHVTVRSAPGQVDRFLEFKRREAEFQLATPGFAKRMLLQELENPDVCYYMSFWHDPAGLATLQANPGYRALLKEYDVLELPPDMRDGTAKPAGEVPTMGHSSMRRMRCEVLVDEAGSNWKPVENPLGFHYFCDTGEKGAAPYEAFKRMEAKDQLDAPGFIKRYFLRHINEPSQFVYFSLWESRVAANEFHARFVATEDYKTYYGRLEPYVIAPTFADCKLIHDQAASA